MNKNFFKKLVDFESWNTNVQNWVTLPTMVYFAQLFAWCELPLPHPKRVIWVVLIRETRVLGPSSTDEREKTKRALEIGDFSDVMGGWRCLSQLLHGALSHFKLFSRDLWHGLEVWNLPVEMRKAKGWQVWLDCTQGIGNWSINFRKSSFKRCLACLKQKQRLV